MELTQFVPQMWHIIYPHSSQLHEKLTDKISDILRRVYNGKLSHYVEIKQHHERKQIPRHVKCLTSDSFPQFKHF